ncbi:MAG: Asp-tRNA(Asn)/Glu-tRNA(Gln) amidotransferase subunit GatA [Sphingomonadales bacterium]
MSELTKLTIAEARDALKAKKFSARELTEAHLNEVVAARPLNAFVNETPDYALKQAEAADKALAEGKAPSLTGIPVAIKDVFCTKGIETTAGSQILKGFIPPYESTVSANLFKNGAVMVGKTNLDEFAMGSSNENSSFGPVISPWRAQGSDEDLVPGGSSGGSSTAVAANLAMGSTGTDTGGSIRQPASLTGIVGLKPSYGRCSRWGCVAFASSLDHPGPFARTVRDSAIMLQAMAGYDVKDSTSVNVPVPDYETGLENSLKGLKVGIPKEYVVDGMPKEIEDLWQQGIAWLKAAGAEIKDISLPHTKYALPAYYIVAPAEASSNLARYDGVRYGPRNTPDNGGLVEMYEATRSAGFGDEVKRRILIGTYVLSAGYYDAYYLQAQKVRTKIADDFRAAFKDIDVILTPTSPDKAFGIGAKSDDPLAMYMNDVFTVPANLAGIPAISVPAGLSNDGLPLGLQIIGPAFEEAKLLNAAWHLEQGAGFNATPKPWWKG